MVAANDDTSDWKFIGSLVLLYDAEQARRYLIAVDDPQHMQQGIFPPFATDAGRILDTQPNNFLHLEYADDPILQRRFLPERPMFYRGQRVEPRLFKLLSFGLVGPKYKISGNPIWPPLTPQGLEPEHPAWELHDPRDKALAAALADKSSKILLALYCPQFDLDTQREESAMYSGSEGMIEPAKYNFFHADRVASGVYSWFAVIHELHA